MAWSDVGPGLGERSHTRLQIFESLLEEWSGRLGLVSPKDVGRLWDRHIADCLSAVEEIIPGDRSAIDLGSGGGLPGMVVAIASPELGVVLAERNVKRAAFLELVVERLALANVSVALVDVRRLDVKADVSFARGFGSASVSWRAAEGVLRQEGRLVYFAGARFDPKRAMPEGVRWQMKPRPVASWGPLVIMSRL